MAQLRVLIVDDSQAMRRSIIYALQRIEGMVCLEALHGAEGLRRLANEHFDLVLTDINMPVMDGLKLIALMRQPGSPHRDLPVVVITTEGNPEDRRRAMALGANAYLVKPLRAHNVLSVVKEQLVRAGLMAAPAPAAQNPATASRDRASAAPPIPALAR